MNKINLNLIDHPPGGTHPLHEIKHSHLFNILPSAKHCQPNRDTARTSLGKNTFKHFSVHLENV